MVHYQGLNIRREAELPLGIPSLRDRRSYHKGVKINAYFSNERALVRGISITLGAGTAITMRPNYW